MAFVSDLIAVGDPSATRTVYLSVTALGVIGLVLVGLAVWLVRRTRPDRQLLAPLERMADRSWRRLDPADRGRSLDDVRPAGAEPVRRTPVPPAVDEEFGQAKPSLGSFDDLKVFLEHEQARGRPADGVD